jgi:3',5'-nucleoside bisphosphate phosphatase
VRILQHRAHDVIDLHCHSTASDGSEAPEVVVELAAAAGLSAVALTDHDGLAGLTRAAERAEQLGIGFVPGCEVSCSFQPGSMHVLCYFVDDVPGPLRNALEGLRADRAKRNDALIARLAELGIPVSRDEVEAEAGSAVIGRPHFAAVLVRHGVVSSVEEAFDTYLAKGRPGYVGRDDIEAAEAIAVANASGGVAVLAHPLSLELTPGELDRLLDTLCDDGLAGMECQYANYDPATREDLHRLAGNHGLVATGGSEFHGRYKPGLFVGTGRGDLAVADEALEALRARRGRPTG